MIRSNTNFLARTVLYAEAQAVVAAALVDAELVDATQHRADQAVVLWRIRGPKGQEHAMPHGTHVMLIGRDDEGYNAGRIRTELIWGHYGLTEERARASFEERAR